MCSCDVEAQPDEQPESKRLCPDCGKPLAVSRMGSLTQWVFAPSLCSCAHNKLFDQHGSGNNRTQEAPVVIRKTAKPKEPAFSDEQKQAALTLDGTLFPQERYKPVALIGKGSTGEVYLCIDTMLEKKVAVKILRQVTPEQSVAFQLEAKATSALNHPNIAKLLDFGISKASSPYMVLDYVPGMNLEYYLRKNKVMPWEVALIVGAELCSALSYAHENGIFHRDIKPSNVLIVDSEDGFHTRLIDFGVAKITNLKQTIVSQASTVVGTPAYMSPDESSGRHYTPRSEIYSLGCLIFECITGSTPFRAESPLSLLAMHAQDEAPSLSETLQETGLMQSHAKGEIPEAVELLVAKCLAKDPQERYTDMAELEEAIDAVLDKYADERISANEPTPEPAVSTQKKGSVLKMIYITIAALVVISAACASYDYVTNKLHPAPDEATMRANKIEIRKTAPPLAKPDPNAEKNYVVLGGDQATASGLNNLLMDRDLQDGHENLAEPYVKDDALSDDDLAKLTRNDRAIVDITIQDSPITDRGLEYLSHQKLLRSLYIDDCHNFTKQGLLYLASSPVTYLTLRNCSINDAYLQEAGKIRTIKELRLDRNDITSGGIKYLTQLPKLELISLGATKIKGKDYLSLRSLKHLKIIDFERCHVSAEDLHYVSQLDFLERVLFSNCKFPGEGIEQLARLPHLKEVHLKMCQGYSERSLTLLHKAKGRSCEIKTSDWFAPGATR